LTGSRDTRQILLEAQAAHEAGLSADSVPAREVADRLAAYVTCRIGSR